MMLKVRVFYMVFQCVEVLPLLATFSFADDSFLFFRANKKETRVMKSIL